MKGKRKEEKKKKKKILCTHPHSLGHIHTPLDTQLALNTHFHHIVHIPVPPGQMRTRQLLH